MEQPDQLVEALRALGAAFVARVGDLPIVERATAFVNARGQLLSGARSVQDSSDAICTFLNSPTRPSEVGAVLDALILEPLLVKNVHRCMNDGGLAYIQAFDFDVAALKSYLLTPLLEAYLATGATRPFRPIAWDAIVSPVLSALRAERSQLSLTTPVLGLRLEEALPLAPGITVRPATDRERLRWSEDESLELSILRDVVVAESVVEVLFTSEWGSARHTASSGIDVGSFDGEPVAAALDLSALAIAVLRLATGRSLPLVFTQEQRPAVPWARNRFFHRPTLDDTVRRFDSSPLWVDIVHAEPLAAEDAAKVTTFWDAVNSAGAREPAVLRAVRLLLHERDYVNLYRIFEIVQSRAGHEMKNWASRSERENFTHTANSAEAVGDSWARHGRYIPAPAKRVTLPAADALVRRLLCRWIEQIAESGDRDLARRRR